MRALYIKPRKQMKYIEDRITELELKVQVVEGTLQEMTEQESLRETVPPPAEDSSWCGAISEKPFHKKVLVIGHYPNELVVKWGTMTDRENYDLLKNAKTCLTIENFNKLTKGLQVMEEIYDKLLDV
jgi:hypothetical protein